MPPETGVITPPTQVSIPLWKRKTVWVPVGTLFILAIGIVIGVNFSNPNSDQSSVDSTSTSTARSLYRSNITNIQFVIPDGWSVNPEATKTLPEAYREPSVVLEKTGSACTVVQAEWDKSIQGTQKHISFAESTSSGWWQFDSSWYVASTTDSAKYVFSDKGRQYLAGEFRRAVSLRTDPFLLFMSDGTSVPDSCSRDFSVLLRTVEPYFEELSLDATNKGLLIVEKVWDSIKPQDSNRSYEHLVFIDDVSKQRYEVMRLPTGTWTRKFSVNGGKIFVPSASAIYVIDPFTKQISQVPGSAQLNTYISDIYIKDDNIYYLAGSSTLATCLDKYSPCAANLYSIPLTGGQPTRLAQTSLGGSILGYVEDESAFYIRQGWGDGGCRVSYINRVVNSKEEVVGKFGDCYSADEAGVSAYKKMQEEVNAIIAKAGAKKVFSNWIRLEGGLLFPASEELANSYAAFYFDKIDK